MTQNSSAFNLAAIRFFYFSGLLLFIPSLQYFHDWQQVPQEFWEPTGLMKLFSMPPIPDDVHSAVFYFWTATIPLCALGFFYRAIAPLNFLAAFLLMNYAHSFGYQTHTYMPLLLIGFPLAFSWASDVFSLDAWWAKRRGLGTTERSESDTNIYERPIQCMKISFTLIFFAAGFAKMRFGGWDWIATDTLRNYFLRASFIFSDVNWLAQSLKLNIKLYEYPKLVHALAFAAVALELSTPLALWSRRLARMIVTSLIFMQIMIYFTIYVNFKPYVAIYVIWINWTWVFEKIRATRVFGFHRREVA